MKNVIKSAPEVTFWGGQRFYDRYDIHPSDYFFLNTREFVRAPKRFRLARAA